jgi:DnaJ domain
MQYLLLGLAALVLFLVAGRAFATANPAVLARQLRVAVGIAALATAGLLVVRGMAGYALSLAAIGAWLLWGRGIGGFHTSGHAQKANGRTSRVVTDHLEVELELDTGAIRGRILKGTFAGRELENMKPVELARLWADCRFTDPQSAQILEAYLDRVHPTWRDDMARADSSKPSDANGKMTRDQALEILGLKPGASEEDIRHAHRELMMKLHPDRGGSTYLAAKINQAKDVLLG